MHKLQLFKQRKFAYPLGMETVWSVGILLSPAGPQACHLRHSRAGGPEKAAKGMDIQVTYTLED